METLVATNTSNNDNLIRHAMCHCPLRHFRQHAKNCLLNRKTQIGSCELIIFDLLVECLLFHLSPSIIEFWIFRLRGGIWKDYWWVSSYEIFHVRKKSWERHVHSLDYIRQIDVLFAFEGLFFDVVAWTWVIGKINKPCKPIQTIANSNVDCFPKYSISFIRVSNDLSIPSTNIQWNWASKSCYNPSHLNVGNAVIHTNNWNLMQKTQCSSNNCSYW